MIVLKQFGGNMQALEEIEFMICKLLIELETNSLINISDDELLILRKEEQEKLLRLQRLSRVLREYRNGK